MNRLNSSSFKNVSGFSDWDCAMNVLCVEFSEGMWPKAALLSVTHSVLLCLFCSRAHSPALGVHSFSGVQRFNVSSHNQSPKRHSISHSPTSNSNGSFLAPETEPIVPELCIDHLWTETITNIRFGVHIFIFKEKCARRKYLVFCWKLYYNIVCVNTPENI